MRKTNALQRVSPLCHIIMIMISISLLFFHIHQINPYCGKYSLFRQQTQLLPYRQPIFIFGVDEVILCFAIWFYFLGGINGSREDSQIHADIVSFLFKSQKSVWTLRLISRLIEIIVTLFLTIMAYDLIMVNAVRIPAIQGLLIPPSADQILYAWSAGVSVLACFMSTVVPGLILVVLLCIINLVYSRKHPEIKTEEKVKLISPQGGKRFKTGIPALLFPIIVLGGIYSGAMTPTEAAAVSILYAIPVSIYIYKGMKWRDMKSILIETGTTTGTIMVMLFVIMIVSRYFVMANIPTLISDFLLSISDNKYIILLMCNIFMVIIGMLMDDVSGMLLCTPLLLPLMTAIGVSPIHFAAIIGVNLGMGNITPPTAPLLYIGCRLTGAPLNKVMKPTLIMLLFAWLPTLLITTYIPQVALFLPTLFGLA